MLVCGGNDITDLSRKVRRLKKVSGACQGSSVAGAPGRGTSRPTPTSSAGSSFHRSQEGAETRVPLLTAHGSARLLPVVQETLRAGIPAKLESVTVHEVVLHGEVGRRTVRPAG